MKIQRQNHPPLTDLTDRTLNNQRKSSTLLNWSVATQLTSLVTAVLLTSLGFANSALAQAQAPINNQSNPFERQPQTVPIPELHNHPDFFEEGQEQLEEEILKLRELQQNQDSPEELLTIKEDAYWANQDHPNSFLTIEDELSEWVTVISTQGRFTISMPDTPTAETEVLETEAIELNLNAFMTDQAEQGFLIAYSDEASLSNPEETFSNVRDQIIEETQAQLLRDRTIVFDGYPGREFRLRTPDKALTYRLYAVEDRLYILRASQPEEWDISQKTARFLNSFEPIPEWG